MYVYLCCSVSINQKVRIKIILVKFKKTLWKKKSISTSYLVQYTFAYYIKLDLCSFHIAIIFVVN